MNNFFFSFRQNKQLNKKSRLDNLSQRVNIVSTSLLVKKWHKVFLYFFFSSSCYFLTVYFRILLRFCSGFLSLFVFFCLSFLCVLKQKENHFICQTCYFYNNIWRNFRISLRLYPRNLANLRAKSFGANAARTQPLAMCNLGVYPSQHLLKLLVFMCVRADSIT